MNYNQYIANPYNIHICFPTDSSFSIKSPTMEKAHCSDGLLLMFFAAV